MNDANMLKRYVPIAPTRNNDFQAIGKSVQPVSSNPHEELSRLRKAIALADILHAAGCSSEEVRTERPASDPRWLDLAAAAGVNPPKGDETVSFVIELLVGREKAQALVNKIK